MLFDSFMHVSDVSWLRSVPTLSNLPSPLPLSPPASWLVLVFCVSFSLTKSVWPLNCKCSLEPDQFVAEQTIDNNDPLAFSFYQPQTL